MAPLKPNLLKSTERRKLFPLPQTAWTFNHNPLLSGQMGPYLFISILYVLCMNKYIVLVHSQAIYTKLSDGDISHLLGQRHITPS